MLLCATCHKLVDDNPLKYTRAELEAHKREHEARIRRLTGLGPSMQTTVVQVRARIRESIVEVSEAEIFQALYPRYPAERSPHIVDLTALGDEKAGTFYALAAERIRDEARRLYSQGSGLDRSKHLSVFGLAPIPLLVTLGSALSNKVPTDFFQCHRDRPDRWTWHEGGPAVRYVTRCQRQGSDHRRVALVLPLSGAIDPASLPVAIDDAFSVYEIALGNQVAQYRLSASTRGPGGFSPSVSRASGTASK